MDEPKSFSVWSHILTDAMLCPSYVLAILVPCQFLSPYLTNQRGKIKHSLGTLDILKMALTILLVVLLSCKTSRDHFDSVTMLESQEYRTVINQIASYLVVFFLTLLKQTLASEMSVSFILFWFSTLASTWINFYQRFVTQSYGMNSVAFWMNVVHITIAFIQCCLMCVRTNDWESVPKTKLGEFVHPQERASWLSDLTLSWPLDTIWIMAKRPLEEADVCDLVPNDQCRHAVSAFEHNFKTETSNKTINGKDPITSETDVDRKDEQDQPIKTHISLVKLLAKTFGMKYAIFQFRMCLGRLIDFTNPVLITAFMDYIQNRENEHWSKGVFIVLGIFFANLFKRIYNHRTWASFIRFNKQVRSSIVLTLYKKSLTIRNECTKDVTTGQTVNLISDDCEQLVEMILCVFHLINAPIFIGVSLYLLYNLMGNATFVGLLIILLLIPLNKHAGNKIHNIQLEMNEAKEKRVKLMNEITNGIKVVKLYAWEEPFMQKVKDIRNIQDNCNKSLSVVHACLNVMSSSIPFIIKLVSFSVFLHLGGRLDVTRGFVAIQLFMLLNRPFNMMTMSIPRYVEAAVSLKRIDNFLNSQDIPHDIVDNKSSGKTAVSISQGKFSFAKRQKTAALRNINLTIPKGKLVAVVGMVGSGKSSLLSAILGEMEKLSGNVKVQGQIAYVPQEAWILNTPLRENVLFGSPMELGRYRRVVKACALEEDIKMMGAGDKTEIGEKGINLSGGQKQRVSLARAVYSDADVYLLDDPLSAVDAHVGKHIFKNVISNKGVLRDKTRVLVTHGIHWLSRVDFILVMKNGQISESGTYEQLTSQEGVFAQYLREQISTIQGNTESNLQKTKQKILNRLNLINERELNDAVQDCNEDFTNLSPNTKDLSSSSSDESVEEEVNLEDLQDLKCTDEDKNGTLIVDEDLEEGRVKFEVYLEYIKAIGYTVVMSCILLFSVTALCNVYRNVLVKQWTDDPFLSNESLSDTEEYAKVKWGYFTWFAITGTIEVVTAFVYVIVFLRGTFKASTLVHNNLLYRILRCPMSFFDTTPSSRIMTRFSKDVSRVDGVGDFLRRMVCHILTSVIYLSLIIVYCPMIVIVVIPISLVYYHLSHFHIGVIHIRRYKSKYRPPILTHFTETLNGLASIRAYKSQNRFIKTMENHIDHFIKFELFDVWASIAFKLRFMLLCDLLSLLVGFICIMDTSMSPSTVGLVVMYAGEFVGILNEFMWTKILAETELVALEKLIEYSNKPSEAAWKITESNLARDWPSHGHVFFNDYKARYRDGLDLVLKGVNCQIKSGEKVGIVGRTGAGKTSLAMAFFRLLEAAEGDIQVDKQIIAGLGLHDLRSRINILPQEPVIFSGSLRMNLDPFRKCSDEDIWTALQHSHLASFVEGLPEKLDFECGEGGKNFSVGQKQLLCLTRTLLRKAKILVLDEATAAVDMETDELIQKTIRTEFEDCTVLTIAHRLNTVMDYDKIMVMENGMVKEFDSPNNLLADQCSIFYGLAKDANLVI